MYTKFLKICALMLGNFYRMQKKNEHKQVTFLKGNSYSVRKGTLILDRERLMIYFFFFTTLRHIVVHYN